MNGIQGQPGTGTTKSAWIAERTTWGWAFWSTSISDVVVGVAGCFFIYECAYACFESYGQLEFPAVDNHAPSILPRS
ncbi:hypothetical protein FIBSPDRAFT_769171 [Athelia psychrophila]|uniref:Uncharacterized protein n=1 Tax=Athelia psychrophila TaxID=1759441 RepID=A0A167TU55_9AGAM|nr:hypothetical protein FIBSPDRAFT_769171 [Fibularhizoctonia sp. CBS 109695]